MSFINFSKANCRNCYKCLRSCPVKAIKFKNEQAEIVEDRCIVCGHCLTVCPQNARKVESDVYKVKEALSSGKKVVASLAPSFIAYLDFIPEEKIIGVLKKLGFFAVEETAIGAEIVSELYRDYVNETNLDNLITTCCPSACNLIEKYFPSLVRYLIPVVSPMIAHGKVIKQFYGEDCFVVFFSPCVAKKLEASESENSVDAVITFDELKDWIEEEKIDYNTIDNCTFDRKASKRGKGFPISGGAAAGIKDILDKKNMDLINVSSTEQCIAVFKSIEQCEIKNVCVEVNVCEGSCVGGPNMVNDKTGFYARQQRVKQYINNKKEVSSENEFKLKDIKDIDFSKEFIDKSIVHVEVNEDEIIKIMHEMGKFEPEDELNCGVCGYNTCREKAQAVLEGMAETNMCLNHMRTKAERLTNVIFENSPNVIIMLDKDMNVIEFNPNAEEIFVIKAEKIKGKPISILIDDTDFIKVRDTKENIIGKKVSYPQYNAVFIVNIVYLEKQNVILTTMNNIMQEEKNKKELLKVKENTLDAAQEVIEKQMRVAQEIAGLLGETTAETKAILTKLKKVVQGEDGEIK